MRHVVRAWSTIVSLALCGAASQAAAPADPAWSALRGGAIVLLRHATAPGIGDPPGFRKGDCATQRNLDATGRAEAVRIGRAFEAHGVRPGRVLASQWCRARETADLAFPGRAREEPVFDSLFADAANDPRQTAAARALLLGWKGPGALVVVTHQVNITALTGVYPASGEGVVMAVDGGRLVVVGRIVADTPGAGDLPSSTVERVDVPAAAGAARPVR